MLRTFFMTCFMSLLAYPVASSDHAVGSIAAPGPVCDRSVVQVQSAYILSRRHLARALIDAGDIHGAAVEYGLVVQEQPDDATAWFDYAAALANDYRFREAAAASEMAMNLDPTNLQAIKIAVIAFERSERYADALTSSYRLAATGDRIAMNDIAEAFLYGRGVAENPHEAVLWFERAASAGHFGAMDRLAHIHQMGLYGREPDAKLAAQWSKRASED